MTTGQTIAAILGPIYIAAGLGMLVGWDRYRRAAGAFLDQPALAYLGGLLAMGLGLPIVVLHGAWGNALDTVVSVVGWLAVVKGAVLLIWPEAMTRLWRPLLDKGAGGQIAGVAALALGGYLSWAAFAPG